MANKSSPNGGAISEGCVSSASRRPQDILREFADEYERVLPFNGLSLAMRAREAADALDNIRFNTVKVHAICNEACDVRAELENALDEVAEREGLWFGPQEGDGSCFGYWRFDDYGDDQRAA
jgi:hypothetical protein